MLNCSRKDGDFTAFERVLGEAVERSAGGAALLAYCVMGDHWHLVIHTRADGELSPFMKWLTLTHTQRYQAAHRSVGDGPLYQGRFKSFVIQKGAARPRVPCQTPLILSRSASQSG